MTSRAENQLVSSLLQKARELLRGYEFEDAIRVAEQAFDLAGMCVHRMDAVDIVDEATLSTVLRDELAACWSESSAPRIRQPRRRDGIHEWDASLKAGLKAEDYLDGVFGERFNLEDPGRQTEGIDRLFVLQTNTGIAFTVDYKADFWTQRTGNLAVETVSNVEAGALGWAYESAADYIMFLPIGLDILLLAPMQWIRQEVDHWKSKHETHCGFTRRGSRVWETEKLLVPLDEFEQPAVVALTRP